MFLKPIYIFLEGWLIFFYQTVILLSPGFASRIRQVSSVSWAVIVMWKTTNT